MTSQAAITTAGLTKHYPGVQALSDLTLEVPAGSIYGFLGPNGAGKTTALKMLAGLTRPTRGTASRGGHPGRRRPGVPAGRRLPRPGAALLRLDDRPRDDRVRRLAVPADARPTRPASRRSWTWSASPMRPTGARRPTPAACASDWASPRRSSPGPAVLLLDEPVSALDPIGRREVLELMAQIKGEVTVFYSTHILDDVERVSDHVAILDHGRLVRAQPTAELLSSFTRDRMRVVLGFATDDTAVALAAIPGVLSVEPTDRAADSRSYLLRIDPDAQRGRPARRDPAGRRQRSHRHRQQPRPRGPGGRLHAPRRHQGACSMTASISPRTSASAAPPRRASFPASAPSSQGAHRMAPRAPLLDRLPGQRPVHDPRGVERLADQQPARPDRGARAADPIWTRWST